VGRLARAIRSDFTSPEILSHKQFRIAKGGKNP
jgi:hypothetical protein